MILHKGLEVLSEEHRAELPRVEETSAGSESPLARLPAIIPVNYRVIDGAVVFWTSPGSKMSAAAEGAVVAFEVDDYQLADRSGWSVLVVGRAEVADRSVPRPGEG